MATPLTDTQKEAVLDAIYGGSSFDTHETTVDGVRWSENGTAVSSNYGSTDSLVANASSSAAGVTTITFDSHSAGGTASAQAVLTHFQLMDGAVAVGGWIALDSSVTVESGGYPVVADDALYVTLTDN